MGCWCCLNEWMKNKKKRKRERMAWNLKNNTKKIYINVEIVKLCEWWDGGGGGGSKCLLNFKANK